MKVTVNAKALSTAIGVVQGVCATRSPVPIYTKVLLRIEDNNIVVAATDGEVLAIKKTPVVDVDEGGQCFVDPDRLMRICRLEDGDLTIDASGQTIGIMTAKDEHELAAEDGDFGIDVSKRGDLLFVSDAVEMTKAFDRTTFSVDQLGEKKYTMCGLRLEVNDDGVSVVATDGKRLSVDRVKGANLTAGEMLIPKKAADAVHRLMKGTQMVNGYANKNTASFIGDDWEVWTRQVEGRFPDYRMVIPKEFTHQFPIDVEEFLKDVKRAAVMTDEESKKLEFKFVGNKVTIKAQSSAARAKVEHLMVKPIEGTMSISVDPKYMIEYLGHMSGVATVMLYLKSHDRPLVFKEEQGTNTHLIVPMV